ncbi:MAG: hypothetical protein ACYSYU_09395 [Planctomycetota bacterium]
MQKDVMNLRGRDADLRLRIIVPFWQIIQRLAKEILPGFLP